MKSPRYEPNVAVLPAERYSETTEPAPFWTKLGRRSEFGGQDGRVALLDLHTPLALRSSKRIASAGDLDDMEDFGVKTAEAGFAGVQLNPINDTGNDKLAGPCPYCAVGMFSYDPSTAALGRITQLRDSEHFARLKAWYEGGAADRVKDGRFDHNFEREYKLEAMRIAYARLNESEDEAPKAELREFCEGADDNVLNYAVFNALKKRFDGKAWHEWPAEFRAKGINGRKAMAMVDDPTFADEVRFVLYTQQVVGKQWADTTERIEDAGANVVMDKAIYPQHDSADVWGNQELFYLNDDGTLLFKSGCKSPGDVYGEQTWGHAVYRFRGEVEDKVIDFLVENVRHMAKVAKVIRLDHVLALVWKYYVVATDEQHTSHHIDALKHKLFQRLKQELPDVHFIAEDVGYVSETEVDQPLAENGLSGMRSPMWGYRKEVANARTARYADVKNYPVGCTAITDNHDTEPSVDWWNGLREEERADFLYQMYGDGWAERVRDGYSHLAYIKLVFACRAQIGATTLRTVEQSTRRHNAPGTSVDTTPDDWSVLSVNTVDNIDFAPVAGIIAETNRRADQVLSGPVIATTPLMGEHQHRSPGEHASLRVAMTRTPNGVTIHTNAPVNGNNGWTELKLGLNDPRLHFTKYADGTLVCEVKLPIPQDSARGTYELSGTVSFNDAPDEQIALHDRNIVLVVR